MPSNFLILMPLVAIALAFGASAAQGQTLLNPPGERAFVDDPPMRVAKQRSPLGPEKGWRVEADGATGIGSFKDIQLPVNQYQEVRLDGTRVGKEHQDHLGFAVGGGLGVHYANPDYGVMPLQIQLWRMMAQTGEPETLASTYSRLQVGSEAYRRWRWGGTAGILGLALGIRRSSFGTMSSSHYVVSTPVGVKAALESSQWALSVLALVAPMSEMGYSEALLLGGQKIPKSTVSFAAASLKGEWRLSRDAWLGLGLDHEVIKATIPEVRAYESFGFDVEDSRSSRAYDLTTSMVTIGIRRLF